MDDYDQAPYEDGNRDYDNRSRSPRRDRDDDNSRARSASPNGRAGDSHAPPSYGRHDPDEPNQGTNLFVTGLSSNVRDDELRDLFAQYGEVEQASIVRDPHSRESRGFGFVNMVTIEDADAVMEKLHGHELNGRAMSVEKAKRNRPRTPTPGRYQGPPKRDMRRGDRFNDRRGGGGRRDDYRGYPRGGDRYSGDRYGSERGGYDRGGDRGERGGDRRYRDRQDYGYGGGSRMDSYGSRRDDRYGGGGGGSSGGYGYGGSRDDRGGSYSRDAAPPAAGGYEGGSGSRGYEDRR